MTQSLKVDFAKKRVKGTIQVFEFNDHQFFIVYSSSLNLSAYGDTADEAKEMFEVVVSDFFEHLLEKPEYVVISELKKLGGCGYRCGELQMLPHSDWIDLPGFSVT